MNPSASVTAQRERTKALWAFLRANSVRVFDRYRLADVKTGRLTHAQIEAAIEAAQPELRDLYIFNLQQRRNRLPEINLTQYRNLQAQAENEEPSK